MRGGGSGERRLAQLVAGAASRAPDVFSQSALVEALHTAGAAGPADFALLSAGELREVWPPLAPRSDAFILALKAQKVAVAWRSAATGNQTAPARCTIVASPQGARLE